MVEKTTNFYKYQIESIKAGKCYVCHGNKTVLHGGGPNGDPDWEGPCPHCGGTGTPPQNDIELLKVQESGVCLSCGLPLTEGSCLEHLKAEFLKLREKVDSMSNKVNPGYGSC